jgi:hypothetical protein
MHVRECRAGLLVSKTILRLVWVPRAFGLGHLEAFGFGFPSSQSLLLSNTRLRCGAVQPGEQLLSE